MVQMVKYMVCTIHGWFRWSNIWFASYTDGIEKKFIFSQEKIFFPYIDSFDGQIYGLHHT